jgi:signal transduction histidine kinase
MSLFPRPPAPSQPVQEPVRTHASLSPSMPKDASARSINILLVDDEPKNLTVLETILEDPEYRMIRAVSADEALLALVAEEFALIILDIQMPGMSGFELADLIKKRKKTASVPIIFLTAYYSEDQHMLEGYETGAVDYLHKPVAPQILRSKVAVFAELHRKKLELTQLNADLERRVEERTADLTSANRALRESEQRLHLAQSVGQIGIWEWDLSAERGTWTDSAWDILDPSSRGQPMTYERWAVAIHPDDRARVIAAAKAPPPDGRYQDEYRIITPSGEVRWVETIGGYEYENGAPVRMVGTIRDLTVRKQMEIELHEASRRKDEFLAMLGHELRNPLAPIHNAVSIMREIGAQDDDLNWCREVVERQATQLTRIVDDLLDVSRVSRGKIQLQVAPVDLAAVVQHAEEVCRQLIDSRGHQLSISLPSEPLVVMGDLTRLTQIVSNLLNNAAKYTDEGGRLSLQVERAADSPASVLIRVQDNGRGFDPAAIDHLFELFYQVDRNLDRSDGGLGIGLSLVRRLVELHGGDVNGSSPGRGKGSEFVVRLPASSPLSEPAETQPALNGAAEATPLKILVVDDNLDSASSMKRLLSAWGHDASTAGDGPSAIEEALRIHPDLILLDIGLPGLDGFEVCRRLRQSSLGQVVIAAMTGYGQDEDRKLSLQAGFDCHLVKPVNLADLQGLISRSNRRRTGAASLD